MYVRIRPPYAAEVHRPAGTADPTSPRAAQSSKLLQDLARRLWELDARRGSLARPPSQPLLATPPVVTAAPVES